MNIEKYGYWTVPGKKFYKKVDALVYATEHNMPVEFVYHNTVFENFDRAQLGKNSLTNLCKERALQLREKYDYLILYFSGGADSYNILTTFINNGIKLDEVCVRWPSALRDNKFYTPNTQDTSARNWCSEWDYSVKPALEWIASNHPNIKITITDYVAGKSKHNMEDLFSQVWAGSGGGMLFSSNFSNSEEKLLLQNKTVGNIYGVDKPILIYDQNTCRVFMTFSDNALKEAGVNPINPNGSEPFYWTPDMPELAFEQAYTICQHYETIHNDRSYMFILGKPVSAVEAKVKNQFQQDLGRRMLYPNWINSFQTDKPNLPLFSDKFFWFYEQAELNHLKEYYIGNLQDRLKKIGPEYLQQFAKFEDKTVARYKTYWTKLHYVTTLTKII
jgi:hypothetical protein